MHDYFFSSPLSHRPAAGGEPLLFPYYRHLTVGRELDDARRLMGAVLLAAREAHIVHRLEQLRGYVAVVLRRRLAADVGTGAYQCLLETVAQLLRERLIRDADAYAAIFGYEVYIGEAIVTLVVMWLVGLLCMRSKRVMARIVVVMVLLFTAGITVCFPTRCRWDRVSRLPRAAPSRPGVCLLLCSSSDI